MGKAQRAHQTTVVSLMMGTSQAPLPILRLPLGEVFSADEVGVLFAPVGVEFASEGFGEDGLGQVVDMPLSLFNPCFNPISKSK